MPTRQSCRNESMWRYQIRPLRSHLRRQAKVDLFRLASWCCRVTGGPHDKRRSTHADVRRPPSQENSRHTRLRWHRFVAVTSSACVPVRPDHVHWFFERLGRSCTGRCLHRRRLRVRGFRLLLRTSCSLRPRASTRQILTGCAGFGTRASRHSVIGIRCSGRQSASLTTLLWLTGCRNCLAIHCGTAMLSPGREPPRSAIRLAASNAFRWVRT